MDKNSVIGFILIALIFIGFTFFQSDRARKAAELQAQQDSIALAQMPPQRMVSEAVLESAAPEGESGASVAIYKDSLLENASKAQESIVTLENDVLEMKLSTRGAKPYSVRLKKFRNYDSTDLYMFRPGDAEYSISLYTGEYIQTKDFNFTLAGQTDSSVVMRLPFEGGGYIEQKYTLLGDSYRVDNQLSFVGMQGVIPRNVSSYDIDFEVTMPRMEKGYKNETQYSKLDYYFDGDKKPVEIGRGRSASKRVESRLSWFAFQQQFFSTIVRAPQQFSSGELGIGFFQQDDPERNLMACSAKMRAELGQGDKVTVPLEFYFGPNDYKVLKSYG